MNNENREVDQFRDKVLIEKQIFPIRFMKNGCRNKENFVIELERECVNISVLA